MAWFWFLVALGMFIWNVFLMQLLSVAQHDVREMKRRMHQQGLNFIDALIRGDR